MMRILNNHADWLDYNYSKVEGNKCREKALTYKEKDNRSNKMGNRPSSSKE